jgi:VWFA-related protein
MNRFRLAVVASLTIAVSLLPGSLLGDKGDKDKEKKDESVFRTAVTLVQVDVVATDEAGNAITNLKPEDFALEENGKKQKLLNVTLHDGKRDATAARSLPANVYSNRVDSGSCGIPVSILLIDGLNTAASDQAYVRQELLRFIATQLQPGQRLAVYALGLNLAKLQDFTTDPLLLKHAIEAFRPTTVVAGQNGTTLDARVSSAPPEGSDKTALGTQQQLDVITTLLNQFQAQIAVQGLQERISRTLAALRVIGGSVEGRPCRKNLIWVSAGYPFTMVTGNVEYINNSSRMADPTAPPPLPSETMGGGVMQEITDRFGDEIRRTTTLLNEARVAIYPVDARGLVNTTLTNASRQGVDASGRVVFGSDYGRQVQNSDNGLRSSQENMKDLAKQTGGTALINRNDIDRAVAIASHDGEAYYTLSYSPDRKKLDNSFRQFKVQVPVKNVRLRYRTGYYAVTPEKDSHEREQNLATHFRDPSFESSDIQFDARVAPPAPDGEITVQFFVKPDVFTGNDTSEQKKISATFYVTALNRENHAVGENGQNVDLNLTPEQFAMIEKEGLMFPIKLKPPAGAEHLRLVIRDNRSGSMGTVTAQLH